MKNNLDQQVVDDFGNEWDKFRQENISYESWNQYFHLFPFDELNENSCGFDMGCGSGRWAMFIAEKVGKLNCIDPSKKALNVAKSNLKSHSNINFIEASVGNKNILETASQDFGYCLGVLHHVPDTAEGIKSCAKLLKKGAPFLLYLYYDFENKPIFYRYLWKLSDYVRRITSVLPNKLKLIVAELIAFIIYLPLAQISNLSEKLGINVSNFPLSDYRDKSLHFIRTDSLDRFGTRLEQRFSKQDIKQMLLDAGFSEPKFSDRTPYWVCITRRL